MRFLSVAFFFFLHQLDYKKKNIDFFPGATSHSSISYACQAQGMHEGHNIHKLQVSSATAVLANNMFPLIIPASTMSDQSSVC